MRDNFEVITSIGNAKIKHVKKLADKSYRRGQGEFVIEGENLLKDRSEEHTSELQSPS